MRIFLIRYTIITGIFTRMIVIGLYVDYTMTGKNINFIGYDFINRVLSQTVCIVIIFPKSVIISYSYAAIA